MSQATNVNSTSADTSRRRFLAFAGAASAVSAGSLAYAAAPTPVHQCFAADAELVAAGAQFEALLTKWMPAWFEWARLHCEAQDEAEAKFGEQDRDNDAWTGTAPAFAFKLEAIQRNGCNAAADIETALFDQMRPLADLIRESEVRSLAGLRAKTLLSILDFWPIGADDENFSSDLTETGHYSLFSATAAITGLSGLVGDIEKQLASNNCQSLRDGAPIIA